MIPFIDLDAQYKNIKSEIDAAIYKVIHSNQFINGPEIEVFEKKFAKLQEVKYCIGTSSGTSALHLAYESIGLKRGDEVIVPTMTFIATVEPLRLVGAIPVFVDIDPVSFNINPERIEKAITKKTKAIVAVHLYGNPCDMDEITNLARKYRLKVIEDCAQAHLAEFKGRKVGNFGDIATFSFYPSKNLGAFGNAGAVITNNIDYYKKLKLLNNHGRTERYLHEIQGNNYQIDTLQAAILNVKMNHISSWTNQRISHAEYYIEKLKSLPIDLPESVDYKKHVFHIFSIGTNEREKIINAFDDNYIAYGMHYPIPLHLQPACKYLGYKKGDFPIAERLAERFISLPIYSEISKQNMDLVCHVIENSL